MIKKEKGYMSYLSDKPYRSSKLIFDTILQPKTFIKDIKNNPYPESTDALFSGLDGWLRNYDKYFDVIKIWQKSIYNINVAEEDLFIWRCQAFELLCTINTEIYDKAFSLKEEKQAYPNLKNFLMAVNDMYVILKDLDAKFFVDVKNVRDKLTHNNPKKTVSDLQKENSYRLINLFLIKTMGEVLNIKGVSPEGFFLRVT